MAKPRKPIARKTPLPRRTQRATPVNAKRKLREWLRAYGSPARVGWVADLPCIACHYKPSENAHVGSGGVGRKGDASTVVPLCSSCHKALHRIGEASFERQAKLDLRACARQTEEAWQAKVDG